ncbi:MAG: GNAT family N-acetyltransferase [Bdellovibrio sp. CG12_big_fil_rev_8_21_14_0_65_39_13]|nr:MAG: GNAT family N-acetyltransferase [Bdellovibrio sp. CG22_combo_CG10-13_8_21_14_all_39_27]PIQ62422.1 MAG: GNAT family N-acetyltransferase [Bdellovibrio sp. CG12_big_fil_rev_8_21_14_0_65_39_13]PIR34089.1 MAG: GNAT family N-acetyltransferase [Bdellovibrio sp. CG11_big_fil_rev_8_21_14_0_20_39_38]PJB53034.1 MAG: GNAT family N-acetyltransferase [Bdellovibrio sp. CG_4_9_14_3_um_filter_39_7]
MMNALTQLKSWPFRLFRLPKAWDIKFSPRFLSYTSTLNLFIETPRYILQSATRDQLIELFELRYQIFLEDGSEEEEDNYDLDQFDHVCDHIVILDKDSKKIVGTYRILCSTWADHYYSQGEFSLDHFIKEQGIKLELGRACIHHGHRNGAVIDLLWRGIGEYSVRSGARYLFGCSSIKTISRENALAITHYFQNQNMVGNDYNIHPIGKFDMKLDSEEILHTHYDEAETKKLVPPLLKSYISAGALVYGTPALDIEFKCQDYFTIIDLEKLNSSYRKRYFKEA